jgi:uroporphyrinogen-III decarboxylase
VHLHNHGPILPILPDIVNSGVDIVCGLFSPPAGDVADLAALAVEASRLSAAGGRRPLALKGMIDPFGALKSGTPAEVEAEAGRQLDAAAGIPFILGTQDGTLLGTPEANLHALVRAGRAWRRKP